MKNNRNMKRRGFTLVELLIVIVVIGVLSAMMMLSSTEAVSSARASNIVSNLRNLKTAALAFYVDHVDSYDKSNVDTNANISGKKEAIMKYMGNDGGNVTGDYGFTGTNSDTWYVYYHIQNDANVKLKLAGRAGSTNLVGADSNSGFTSASSRDVYKAQNYVGMFIR